jgi:exosortase
MMQTYKSSLALAAAGLGLYILGRIYINSLSQNDYASLTVFSSVLFLIGSFIFIYGIDFFKYLAFPLLFLFFMVPFPSFLMDQLIYALQVGSTEAVDALFAVTGVSYLREGFVYHVPGQSIEVAKACSGIRSGLALFITALLAGHLFLNTWWKKVILVVCIFPITIFKNGIRIVSLTLLGAYVDPRILQGSLHRDGGIPFFIVGLFLLAPILFFLRRSEKTKGQGKSQNAK